MAINLGGQPFRLTAEEMGVPDYQRALQSGFKTFSDMSSASYKPKQLAESLLAQQLQNKINQPKADYAKDITLADLAHTQAGTSLTNQNAYAQQIKNQFLPESERSRIDAQDIGSAYNLQQTRAKGIENETLGDKLKLANEQSQADLYKSKILNEYLPESELARLEQSAAMSDYYRTGGSRGSAGSKDYMAYKQGVATDNPTLNPHQLQEATDVLAKGGTKLQDGTPLNPMSFGTNTAFNRAVKATTTAGQINSLNAANQADAELDVFNNYTNQWIKPYATTYYGKSPQQIVDTFKNDDKSQSDLGHLIAANTLEYEKAQIRNRIAAGQPGITATHELMREAKQYIDTVWPRLSAKARKAANDGLNEAIQAGLKARNKTGAGAGGTYSRQFEGNKSSNVPRGTSGKKTINGKNYVQINGEWYE